jgi:hypothetical protein
MFVLHRKHITSPLRLMRSIGVWRWYINITITILDIVNRPVFYLNHTMSNVRTSQEAHNVSATSPNGECCL